VEGNAFVNGLVPDDGVAPPNLKDAQQGMHGSIPTVQTGHPNLRLCCASFVSMMYYFCVCLDDHIQILVLTLDAKKVLALGTLELSV
jgi:hypothetical protein